jgi:hypothetical protein
MAMAVRRDAEVKKVTRPLGDLATKRGDGAIVVSEGLGAWSGEVLDMASPAPSAGDGGALLKARVPTLLGLLGRADAPGKATTALSIRKIGDVVTVSAGRGGVGPIQLVLGALVP